jgi:hypothetical protein
MGLGLCLLEAVEFCSCVNVVPIHVSDSLLYFGLERLMFSCALLDVPL